MDVKLCLTNKNNNQLLKFPFSVVCKHVHETVEALPHGISTMKAKQRSLSDLALNLLLALQPIANYGKKI